MFGHNNQDQNRWQRNDHGSQSFDEPVADGVLGDSDEGFDQQPPSGHVQGPMHGHGGHDNMPNDMHLPPTPAHQQSSSQSPLSTDELLEIKQEVLQQLSPLVSQLEQSPEEKFRTTMMMIQAVDNHTLIRTAYDLAQQIPDEKARAQALLDIVNEINYFTQQSQNHHN